MPFGDYISCSLKESNFLGKMLLKLLQAFFSVIKAMTFPYFKAQVNFLCQFSIKWSRNKDLGLGKWKT